MRSSSKWLSLTAIISIGVIIGCVGDQIPIAPGMSKGGTNERMLDEVYVTAPYTYYCYGGEGTWNIPCNNSGGQYISNLNQSQIFAYCKSPATAEYCNFQIGGSSGYIDANPYMDDELNDGNNPGLEALPNCSQPQNVKERIWCNSPPIQPGTARYQKVQAALNKMRALATPDFNHCAELADEGQRLLDAGLIHTFPKDSLPRIGGFATDFKMGTPDAYMGVSDQYADLAFDEHHTKRAQGGNRVDLQLILAHELDHLWGVSGHLPNVGGGELFTTYTQFCSGLGDPVG